MTPNDLITAKETAQRLHIAVGTLKRWRRSQSGPPWCRIGSRTVRYPEALLESWLACQEVGAILDAGACTEGKSPSGDLTGIILTPPADQEPQPRRWNFLANVRPQGG